MSEKPVKPEIGNFHLEIFAVGSRVTCNPAPTGTDQDWLVLVDSDNYGKLAEFLLNQNWIVGGSMIPEDVNWLPPAQRFNSFTLGEDNLIITHSHEFFKRFLSASAVAKSLNLLKKEDRIALFQAVIYGNTENSEFQPTTPIF